MSGTTSLSRRLTRRAFVAGALVASCAFGPLVTVGRAAGQAGQADRGLTGQDLAAVRLHPAAGPTGTVWLCRPGMANDPCASGLGTSVVQATGATSVVRAHVHAGSKFDCFYIYPTVSTEASANADLRVQPAEVSTAIAQAAWFSSVCRVWAPIYRQVTLTVIEKWAKAPSHVPVGALPDLAIAYQSLRAGFEDYLRHHNHGRPIVLIGHSQGATMATRLLQRLVDNDATLRRRLVLAILPGGNVVVSATSAEGGSFAHIPLCTAAGQAGCVIAYSSFPGEPPAGSLFGRPGQGVSLMAGQTATRDLRVACVNPAALGGGSADLDPLFPTEGLTATPWAELPGLYRARCHTAGGASWLQVTKATGADDLRPLVRQREGPKWGYHAYDINLALGNLVADVASAEASWSKVASKRIR